MALWNYNGEIVYSDGALSISNPESGWATRHYYKVPFTNVGKGGLVNLPTGKFHTPSWMKVHDKTTLDDIIVDKKPFEELFVEEKNDQKWSFKSASSDKEYTVRYNKAGNLSCDCWGYIAHKKCKHIKQVEDELQKV